MFLYVIDTKSRRARDNRIIFFSGNLNTAVVFLLATPKTKVLGTTAAFFFSGSRSDVAVLGVIAVFFIDEP